MKTFLVYDDLYQKRGGERFFLDIVGCFDKPVICVPIVGKNYKYLLKKHTVVYSKFLSFLSNTFGGLGYKFACFLSIFWFESLKFNHAKRVVILCNRFSNLVVTPSNVNSYLIVTTPFRYLWEKESYNFFARVFLPYLRNLNLSGAHRHNLVISISSFVALKVKKYWQVDSLVLAPPVSLKRPAKSPQKPVFKKGSYYLMVGNTGDWKYKQAEKVIKLFSYGSVGSLLVVGSGKYTKYLKQKYSCNNVVFVQNISDSNLTYCYKNCIGLIHPQVEDFGLTPLECLKNNKPVIANASGGVLDYLNPKVSYLYSNFAELKRIIKRNDYTFFDRKESERIVKLHSFQNFKYNLNTIIKKYEKN
jgi:hypothetical protein